MALASAKQLLDELMGRERNLAPDDKKNLRGYEEPEVCKHFLVNFCPNELFVNTKADLGPCSRVHDEKVKGDYKNSPHFQKLGFEEDFLRFCQGMLGDVEKRIRRAKQRLALGNAEREAAANPPPTAGPKTNEEEKMQVISERINELLEQVEQLGCEGKVEEAQGIMKLCDQLKEEREAIKRATEPQHWLQQTAEIAAAQEKQMEVCEVCGAFLIVGDAQQRVDDHLMGKQHVGYARLKAAVEEIMFKRDKEKEEREKQRNKERLERQKLREEEEKTRSGGRSKDRRSSSSKDSSSRSSSYRDRNGSRRSRSRDRSRDRSRRHKSSSRERSRRDDRKDRNRSRRSSSREKKNGKSHRRDSNRRSRSHSRTRSEKSFDKSSRSEKRRSSGDEDESQKNRMRSPDSGNEKEANFDKDIKKVAPEEKDDSVSKTVDSVTRKNSDDSD